MLWGAAATLVMLVVCALANNWIILAVCVFALGMVNALFVLARQAYLTEATSPLKRARAMSTLGGVQRIGALIGPFLGGGIMAWWGSHGQDYLPGAYWLAVVTTLATGIVVYAVPEIATPHHVEPDATTSGDIIRLHWRMFVTLGIGAILVGAVRATRSTVLPLWSDHLGLAASTTSFIFGLSGVLDAALFYPAGRVMDRMGRMWVAIPSMIVLGGSLILLPATHSVLMIALVALMMGFGNGIGSGILMTLGADMAPPAYRSRFLGVWRVFGDSGAAIGPLVVALGAVFAALGGGILVMGAAGLVSAGCFALFMPRYTPHANRRTRRAAGLTPQGNRPPASVRPVKPAR